MKEVITPEDLNYLEDLLEKASKYPWRILKDEDVDSAWVCPDISGNPIALFDYGSAEQNKSDALFVVSARNYIPILIKEIKILRSRILELVQANNKEIQKRIDAQTELSELKKLTRDFDENI